MPHARNTDPATSHEAADTVRNISATQAAILAALRAPMTDEQLVDTYYALVDSMRAPNASPSGIRSRRAELARQGLVVDTGERRKLVSGRHAILWKAA